jgi:hypothetical protein
MRGINLIPAGRIQARRRAARVRAWATIVPVVAAMLFGGYVWLRTMWPTDSVSLTAKIAELETGISRAEVAITRARAEAAQRAILLRAHRAVGEQPDWGFLLHSLSQHVGDRVVFTACVLEPQQPAGGAGPARAGGRPDRFRLVLHGMGRQQQDISAFVIALEGAGEPKLFDSVALMETRRVPLGGKDAVAFRIECAMTDGIAEGR